VDLGVLVGLLMDHDIDWVSGDLFYGRYVINEDRNRQMQKIVELCRELGDAEILIEELHMAEMFVF
jgi:hypothetical protein